jgi:hypothetical protein
MASGTRVHDRAVLDALEDAEVSEFSGTVWRITRAGRSPIRGSAANGRWSPGGDVEVLYTSLEREGALAEIGFRLSLEPIWPSRLQHELHQVCLETQRTLRFVDTKSLLAFGVDSDRYSSFEYDACQALSAAAHFLGYDGLIVPGARHEALNLVLFMDSDAATTLECHGSEAVDWADWRSRRRS